MISRPVLACLARLAAAAGLLCLATGSASAASLDEIKKAGTMKIVTTASSPPHGFVDPRTSKLSGIMVEVAELVSRDLGVKAEFSEVPFGGLIGSITSGRSDLMSAPLFITAERAQVLDFSNPVYGWGEGIIVREDSTKTFTDNKSLAGNTIGVLVGSVQLNMLKDVPGIKEVRTYPDYVTILAEIRAGRIDGALIDPPSVAYQIKDKNISGVKFVKTFKPENSWQVGLAVNKGNTALIGAVNESLAKNKAEIGKILEKWGVGDLAAK